MRGQGLSQSLWLVGLLLVLDAVLLILAFFLIQEGQAQAADTNSKVFFVEFPTELLPLAYAAAVLLVANFAITFFTLLRGLYVRRWPWVTTLTAGILLGVVCAQVGFENVWGIVDPGHGSAFRN